MGSEKLCVNNRKASWRYKNYRIVVEILYKLFVEGKDVTTTVTEVETLRELSPHRSIDSLAKQLVGTKDIRPIRAIFLHKKKVEKILEEAIKYRKTDRQIEFVVATPHLNPQSNTVKRKDVATDF